MNDLQRYCQDGREAVKHPLLRRLTDLQGRKDFREARLEVQRPRDSLGFQPATMYLHLFNADVSELPYPPGALGML